MKQLLVLIFLFPAFSFAQKDARLKEDIQAMEDEFKAEGLEEVTDERNVINDNRAKELKRKRLRIVEEKKKRKKKAARQKRWRKERRLYFGLGGVAPFLGAASKTEQGASKVWPPRVLVSIGAAARLNVLNPRVYLTPGLTYSPLGVTDVEDGASTRVLTLAPLVAYTPLNRKRFALDLKAGPTAFIYFVGGGGGTVVLNNGNSTTTFYKPGLSSTSSLLGLDGGITALFTSNRLVRLDLDVIWTGPFSERSGLSFASLVHIGVM